MTGNDIILRLENICWNYGAKKTSDSDFKIKDFNLEVERSSFTTILGPSGCGKTTLLRLIAGFMEPSAGKIYMNDKCINDVPVEKRDVSFVFQDYALFPHMTVKENLMYGLNAKKLCSKKEGEERIYEAASSLCMEKYLNRYPEELSGGQQQRVALARSVVMQPQIILMDEPLSSLDKNLREKIRGEIKLLQSKFKVTTIYVTHDQEEALSLSDKIAVLNNGSLLQYESPRNIYFKPANSFTAAFVGKANYIEKENETVLVRPEWLRLCPEDQCDLKGTIVSTEFLGERIRLNVKLLESEKTIVADIPTFDLHNITEGSLVAFKIIHSWQMKT